MNKDELYCKFDGSIINNQKTYPHYVIASVLLKGNKVIDYYISINKIYDWNNRLKLSPIHDNVREFTHIGRKSCEYNYIKVDNEEQNDKAFDELEKWVLSSFRISRSLMRQLKGVGCI